MVEHPCFTRAYIFGQGALEGLVGGLRTAQNQRAKGKTLVVGAGTGLDIPRLGDAVSEILLLEPDAAMRDYLQGKYPAMSVNPSAAEHMDIEDEAFDTVISSLVLCSVQNLSQSLSEIHRVLRKGGQYLFMEHVQHHAAASRVAQNVVNPLWKRMGGGCNLNRDVYGALKKSPLKITEYSLKKPNFIVPIVSGRAVKET